MLFDISSKLKITPAINPQAISSNTTITGTEIDLVGYESCVFAIQSGALTDGSYAVEIQESDTSGSGFTAVSDTFLIGTEALAGFSATDDNKTKKIGYNGKKRFVKILITSTGVTTGGIMGASAILSHAKKEPIQQEGAV